MHDTQALRRRGDWLIFVRGLVYACSEDLACCFGSRILFSNKASSASLLVCETLHVHTLLVHE